MRIRLSRLAAVIMVLALAVSMTGAYVPVTAQQTPSLSQSVIAHGVDSFDGSAMSWQVSQKDAADSQNATPMETVTGFVYASGGPLTMADSSTEQGDYIREGAAAFNVRGINQIVTGGTSTTTYTQIALTSDDLGATYTSNPVQTPNGSHAVELISISLASGTTNSYTPVSEFAYLLHVADGSVTLVDDENTSYDRNAGESITVTGDMEITATSNATVLIASIGPEVTVPSLGNGETGTLTVEQFDCPAGTDPTSDASSCTAVVDPWFVNIHPSGREDDALDLNIPDDGVNENGKWTWTEMSEGTWYITPAASESDNFQIVVTGATAGEDHYNAEISAGEETVVSIYLVGERPTGNGWLDIIRTTCDVPLTDLTVQEMEGCPLNTDGAPSFSLQRVNDDSVRLDETSVTLTEEGYYRVSDLPAGVYVISFNVPEQEDLRVRGDVTNAGGMLRYTFFIAPEGGTRLIYAEGPYAPDTSPDATPAG